ncbi:zinc finger, CCHC-type containing protein [Tanacetum coccineum]
MPPALVPAQAGQQVAPEALAAHVAWVKGSKEIDGLMLINSALDIQRNLENLGAYEMLQELKTLFAQHAKQELLQTVRCYMSQGNGKNKLDYVPKPKITPPPKRENHAKDSVCHQCGDTGNWKRNYPYAIPCDDIFEIDLADSYTNDSSMYAVSKRAKVNLDSALLWHYRLGHISKKRIKKLQHDVLLDSTDLRAFEKCVSCMSGKMARKPYTH